MTRSPCPETCTQPRDEDQEAALEPQKTPALQSPSPLAISAQEGDAEPDPRRPHDQQDKDEVSISLQAHAQQGLQDAPSQDKMPTSGSPAHRKPAKARRQQDDAEDQPRESCTHEAEEPHVSLHRSAMLREANLTNPEDSKPQNPERGRRPREPTPSRPPLPNHPTRDHKDQNPAEAKSPTRRGGGPRGPPTKEPNPTMD